MKIIERLYDYLDFKKIKPAAFERATGISNGYLSKQFGRRADIGEGILIQILEYCPDINVEWLLFGQGEMLKRDDIASGVIASDVTAPYITNNNKGIPLIPITAFAGFGALTFEDLQIEHYYEVPEFKQADFLMRIKGNSMYPKYSSGDIVACAIIEETLFFQWNKIYAIYTKSQGVLVKRVKPSKLKDHILLVSDNTQYDPFDVPVADISRLALIIGVIRVE